MAEAVSGEGGADVESLPAAEPAAAEGAGSERRLPGRTDPGDQRRKFRVVYALLGVVLAGAVVGLVALLAQPSAAPVGEWSDWEPRSEAAEDRAQEIATFVGGRYHLPSGAQLVSVQAAPPRVQDIPVAAVAIRSAPDGATFSGESIPVFPADETIVYILCGLGPECAIEEGEPSEERQRLLRRESLELALYTFRYLDGIESVVAFMPPRAGYQPAYALFFQRPELEALLDDPLRTILPADEPPLAEQIPATEVNLIDRLTNPRFYAFTFQQLQDGTAVLVLDDPRRAPPPQPIEATDTTGDGATGDGTTGGSTEPAG